MGILSTLFNSGRAGGFKPIRQFVTFTGQGDNALATIKDVNGVLNAVNVLAKNSGQIVTTQFAVSAPIDVPVAFPAARGTAASGGPWDICQGTGTDCGSTQVQVYKKINSSMASFAVVSPGVYTVTLSTDVADNTRFAETSIQFGNLPVAGFVSVVKVSKFVYTVTTYNAAGVATANLFDDTLMTINWYTSKLANEWLQI